MDFYYLNGLENSNINKSNKRSTTEMVKTTCNEDIAEKDLVKLVEKRKWLKTQIADGQYLSPTNYPIFSLNDFEDESISELAEYEIADVFLRTGLFPTTNGFHLLLIWCCFFL